MKTAKMTCELHLGDSLCYFQPSHQRRASPVPLLRSVCYQHWKVVSFIFKHDEKETNETRKEYYSEKKRENTVLNILKIYFSLVLFF